MYVSDFARLCCVLFSAIRSFHKLRPFYMILNDNEIKEKWLLFCYESTMSSTGVFLRLSIVLLSSSKAKRSLWTGALYN